MTRERRRTRWAIELVAVCGLLAVGVLLISPGSSSRCGAHPGKGSATGCRARPVQKPAGRATRLSATPSATCSSTIASASAVESAVSSAPAGTVICLSAGSYAGLTLSGRHAQNIVVQPAPGQRVTITTGAVDSHNQHVAVVFAPGASHIMLHGFYITNEVELEPGDSFIRIDHNDISRGWYGIQLDSSNCTAPNAPTWSGCTPLPKITNTVISGNRIHDIVAKADALNVDNYAGLRVTGNDIFDLVEGGDHTDCLQSTFGGTGLVFDHNYEHDNECQGFFLKDGDVTDVTFDDNLFLRDEVAPVNGGSAASTSQVYNTRNFVAEHNTILDSKGLTLRCIESRVPCTATINHNVLALLTNGNEGDATLFKLNESYNIFGRRPWSFQAVRTDQQLQTPFVDPATDDYRLVHNPQGIGIDWAPAAQHYGP